MRESTSAVHYGWHIVWAGTLCVFASLGLGRFALGMLLPAMGASLQLSYAQMGWVGTMNFVGYLVAVFFCGALTARFGHRRLISLALLVIGLSTAAISRATSLWLITLLYSLTGFCSGAANVPMMALISSWFSSHQRGRALGFVVIGSGFAILLAGKVVPLLNASGPEGWRRSWAAISAVVLVVSLVCWAVLRNCPQEKGLHPYGQALSEGMVAPRLGSISAGELAHLGAIYFLFGITYVVYVTFLVTTMIEEWGMSEAEAGSYWAWVGFLSLFSGPVFGSLSDRIGRQTTLSIVFSIQSASYLLIAVHPPLVFLSLSIACFGLVVWSIPSIMAALIGDYAGPEQVARVFGRITFIFALGQIAGPAGAGYLAEQGGSFALPFLLAGGLALLAAVLSATLRRPANRPGHRAGR